jgi:choline kinase
VHEIAVVVGYRHRALEAALRRLPHVPSPLPLFNARYEEGSVVSLQRACDWLRGRGDVLLMDADVLCPASFVDELAERSGSAFLIDRELAPEDAEAVKICVHAGQIVEFRKQVDSGLQFDYAGQSVGFFRLSEAIARELAELADHYLRWGRCDQPYEELLRDLVRMAPEEFALRDVSGAPWIEIDYPEDLARAEREILPRIERAPGAHAETQRWSA